MINDKQSKELAVSAKDAAESMDIVTDTMLTLDDKTGNLISSTKDLTAAYDINSDSSVQVASEQEKLATQIKNQRKGIKRREKNEDGLESKRREQLEEILNRQQPLVDHTDKGSGGSPIPEETRETLEEFIKREVGNKDDFVEDFKKENGKTGKFIREIAKKANLVDRMKKSETSATAKILGHTMSAGIGMITGSINDILSSIPGYQQAASATKFVGGAIMDAHGARKEKRLDEQAKKAYESKKADAVSKFRQIPSGPTGGGDTTDQVKEERDKADTKKERDEGKQERDRNEKRHTGLMKWLKAFQSTMLFSKIIGFLLPLGTMLAGLSGAIPALVATISGLGATIAAALSAAVMKLMTSVKDIFTGKKTPSPTKQPPKPQPKPGTKAPEIDPKTGKPKPGPSMPEPKPGAPDKLPGDVAGKTAGKEIAKDTAGKTAGKTIAKEGASKLVRNAGAKAALGTAAKMGLRMIPFVGTALTLYEIGSYLYDNPDVVEKGKDMLGQGASAVGSFFGIGSAEASESKLDPVIRSGEDQAQAQRIEEGNRKVEEFRRKQDMEKEERQARRAGAEYAAIQNTTYNSMSSVLPSGFGPYNSESPIGSYGVQPIS